MDFTLLSLPCFFWTWSLNDLMRLLGKPDTGAGPPANIWGTERSVFFLLLVWFYCHGLGLTVTDNWSYCLIIVRKQSLRSTTWKPRSSALADNPQHPLVSLQQFNTTGQIIQLPGVQFATNSSWVVHQEAILPKLDVLGAFYWEFLRVFKRPQWQLVTPALKMFQTEMVAGLTPWRRELVWREFRTVSSGEWCPHPWEPSGVFLWEFQALLTHQSPPLCQALQSSTGLCPASVTYHSDTSGVLWIT